MLLHSDDCDPLFVCPDFGVESASNQRFPACTPNALKCKRFPRSKIGFAAIRNSPRDPEQAEQFLGASLDTQRSRVCVDRECIPIEATQIE